MIFLEKFSTLSEKRAGVLYDGGSCTRVWPSFFPTKNPRDWPSGSLLWEKTACETEKRLLGEKASSASAFVFFQKNRGFLPFGLSEKTESDTTYQNVQGYCTTVVAVSGGGRTFSKKTQGLNLRSFYCEVALKLKPSSERENDFNFSFVQFSERAEGVNLLPF